MPYIGNPPAERFTSFAYQDLTGGSGTSFTLNNAVGNPQEIEVFVNNVRQEPGVAYTVSGTALTMTGSIASTDDFYVVFQGKAIQTATHPSDRALTATEGTFTGDLTVNTSNLKVDTSTGRVGVGTNSPQSLTHFKGTASGENILHLDNSAGSAHGDTNNNVRVVSGNNGYWANLVVAGHQLEFKVQGGTSMLRVDSDGVKFNNSTAAANALDDYEEGTWTAQMLGTASNPSATVTAATATYKKVGAIVWAGATFVGVNTTGASGGVVVSGMPFNTDFTVPMGNVMSQNTFNVGSTVANITPYWASSTQVWFYHTLHGSNIWGAVQHSAGTSRYLYLSLIYTTAS